MAYDINDWNETELTRIKVAPVMQDGQRIKDITSTTQTIEVIKQGLNFTNEFVGYWDGASFIHYMKSDGDAQLRWNYSSNQIVKDTKYLINVNRVNATVELDYFIELSGATDPSFKLYDINDTLLATFGLISAGSTNKVMGTLRVVKVGSVWVITAVYSYLKNTTWYHDNQSGYVSVAPAKVSFGCQSGYTYNSSSYVKITNK